MKSLLLKSMIYLFVVVSFSSCATVFSGKKNTISTDENFPENVEVYLNDSLVGKGVFKTRVDKNLMQHGGRIILTENGISLDTIVIERKVHALFAITDVITTLGIALIVDASTGNIYRPINARKISYNKEEIK